MSEPVLSHLNKTTYLLGFNEPDEKKQGNVSVEEALEFWPKLMELGLPLGSPGCVHPDREWIKGSNVWEMFDFWV